MSLRKITFENSSVRAADHGALFAGILADGIISGCDISVESGQIAISPGFFIAAGRLIQNNNDLTNSGFSNNIVQIVLEIDTSDENASLDTMLKWYQVQDIATANEHEFVRQDINAGGVNVRYDLEIAVIDISQSTIIRKMPICARPINVLDAVPAVWDGYADGIYLIRSSE